MQTKAVPWSVVRFAVTSMLAIFGWRFVEHEESIEFFIPISFFGLPTELGIPSEFSATINLTDGFVVFALPAVFTASTGLYDLRQDISHLALFTNTESRGEGPIWGITLQGAQYMYTLTCNIDTRRFSGEWLREVVAKSVAPFYNLVRLWSHPFPVS